MLLGRYTAAGGKHAGPCVVRTGKDAPQSECSGCCFCCCSLVSLQQPSSISHVCTDFDGKCGVRAGKAEEVTRNRTCS
jgi:hypothetical protein